MPLDRADLAARHGVSSRPLTDAIPRAVQVLAADGDPDLLTIAAGIHLWFSGEGISFDAALNLSPGWRSELRRRQRDAALLAMADRHFPGMQGREAARAVAAAIGRYETTAWLRDRRAKQRPDGLNGDAYDVLSFGRAPMEETLRRLLAG